MEEKWKLLHSILDFILDGVPEKISSDFRKLLPPKTEPRFINFGEKMDIHSFVHEKLDFYILEPEKTGLLEKFSL